MGNYLSAFTIYEMLRIVIPGFYATIMLEEVLRIYSSENIFSTDKNLEYYIIFFITSVILGAFIYSLDFCRIYKNWLDYLPTNMIKEEYPEKIKDYGEREIENLYYRFYYKLPVANKVRTEIQSGIYHLFSSITFASLIFLILFIILSYSCERIIFIRINLYVLLSSLAFTISIYKLRLRYSWKRNFEEFQIAVKNSNTKEELYKLT